MADYIPHMTSDDGGQLVKAHYSDAAVVRVPLDNTSKLMSFVPKASRLWIDPCIDGCDDIGTREKSSWFTFMKLFTNFQKIGEPSFQEKPVQKEVDAFVNALLTECLTHKPAWITVPQLPVCDGNERNKVNRALALATGKWKASHGFSGHMILPLVFTHQRQVNSKTNRKPKVQLAERCYQDAQADGLWVVDKSIVDDNGSPTLRNKRFPGILAVHEELNERIESRLRVAGPYWGLNLVLWAKGLVDHPLIGVGAGYQFFMSGGHARHPKTKIAIPSLRRRVTVSPALAKWLEAAMSKLGIAHPMHAELSDLRKRFTVLNDRANARAQVAEFYKSWFGKIASVPKAGRSMALFQDLSAAYALGKSLPAFEDEGTARRPEAIAESLMLSCL